MPRSHLPLTSTVAVVAAAVLVAAAAEPARADQWRAAQWYLDQFDITAMHELTTGEGVTIGLIDSGTDVTHPDLQGVHITAGIGFGNTADPFIDTRDHGTSMAALAVGQGHGPDGTDGVLGIAPGADLIVMSFDYDDENKHEVGEWEEEAIYALLELGADVITTSIGGVSGNSRGVQDAIDAAMAAGVPFIASAGNSETYVLPGCTSGDCGFEDAPTEDTTVVVDGLTFPAWYEHVIQAFGYTAERTRWENSPSTEVGDLAISAPAHDLVAAMSGGGYSIQSGTSGAAPIIAGVFALVRSLHPDANWDQLVNLVLSTTDDTGAPGYDEEFGWGQINPMAALTSPLPAAVDGPEEPGRPSPTAAPVALAPPGPPAAVQNTLSVVVLAIPLAALAGAAWLLRRRRARQAAVAR
ncbi:S8 family serine peptidase [Occultella aeris]|uniref:Intracellular serine protease n=1 Tax=Occultella aeris TaxID=2761496 RepID=A0A7M4DN61_9MICO|nr:S8 family serine peptidase [Occultella aeris]VZO38871.1 Intracellular serine protease [Occultella aeris]